MSINIIVVVVLLIVIAYLNFPLVMVTAVCGRCLKHITIRANREHDVHKRCWRCNAQLHMSITTSGGVVVYTEWTDEEGEFHRVNSTYFDYWIKK